MVLRISGCCAALIVATLLSPIVSPSVLAAPVCEGAECPAGAKPAKPLNIMKFMREQAASTRAATPPSAKPRPVAQTRRPAPKTIAAQVKPAKLQSPLPVEAAKSFASNKSVASQPEQAAPAVGSADLNAIDRAAAPARAETIGAAPSDGQNVQMVDSDEFNDIDRKAYDGLLTEAARLRDDAKARGEQQVNAAPAYISWLQWIWSATTSTLAALSAAVHQLIG